MKGHIDRKVTIWQRFYYEIKTEDVEEAKQLLRQEAEQENYPTSGKIVFWELETLFDTEERMTEKDNDGQTVTELELYLPKSEECYSEEVREVVNG